MSKSVLQHVFKIGLLEEENPNEVIYKLPEFVSSTFAITAVSCFSSNGNLNIIQTPEQLDWIIQSVSYCMLLPSMYSDSISKAIKIFHYWIFKENFFEDTNQRNEFLRRSFKILSCLFDTSIPKKKSILLELSQEYGTFYKDLHQQFDQETTQVFIKLIIGIIDYIFINETYQQYTKILQNLLNLLFVCVLDNYSDSTLWDIFVQFCKNWGKFNYFLNSWSNKTFELLCTVTDSYLQGKLNETNEFQKLETFFSLFDKSLNCIDENIKIKTISQIISNTINYFKSYMRAQTTEHISFFPLDIFFDIFGDFIFSSYQTKEYKSEHFELINNLFELLSISTLSLTQKHFTDLSETITNIISTQKFIENSYHLFKNQIILSETLINSLFDELIPSQTNDFDETLWINYSLLIVNLSFYRKIPKDIIKHIFNNCNNRKVDLNLLFVLSKQNSDLFLKQIIELYKKDFFIIPTYNNYLSSLLPFINFEDLFKTIFMILSVINAQNDQNIIISFLLLILQLNKLNNELSFNNNFQLTFSNFLSDIYEKDLIPIKYINYLKGIICSKTENNIIYKNTINYLIGNKAILMFNENVIQIFDSFGFYYWNLTSKEFSFSTPISERKNNQLFNVSFYFKQLRNIIKEEEYVSDSSADDQKDLLSEQLATEKQKAVCIQYLIESGIYEYVKEINEPIEKVICDLKKINVISEVYVPVYKIDESNYFNEFYSIFKNGEMIPLGLISLYVKENCESEQMISIIYSESPDMININYKGFPNSKLKIFVRRLEKEKYYIQTVTNCELFWSIFENKLIVKDTNDLLSMICSAIQMFLSIKQRDLFLPKQEPILEYFKSIPSSKVHFLESIKSNFKKIDAEV